MNQPFRVEMRAHPESRRETLEAELTTLFAQHADFLWRALRRCGVPDPELEDAMQEVLVVVARKLPEYEERGAIRAWLYTIARQVAQHALRAAQRRVRREGAQDDGRVVEDPHTLLERSEAARFVEEFLAGLGEPLAAVFYLAEIEGLTAPEIATCVGAGLNTVYSRLRLARERFERALAARKERFRP